jgi:hypothetical protein
MSRRTLDELEELAHGLGPAARVEVDNDEGIAVLLVNGRETGHYAALSAFSAAPPTEPAPPTRWDRG